MASFQSRCIKVNVYDLHQSNSWLQHIGLGLYHSGVEIGGVEYTFSEAGVVQHAPRRVEGEHCRFKTSEVMGEFIGSANDLHGIIRSMCDDGFHAGSYNIARRNCNHFADELCFVLLGKRIPRWVNRAANIGGWAVGGGPEQEGKSDKRSSPAHAENTCVARVQGSANKEGKRRELTEKQKELLSRMKTKRSSSG
ncbi:unnamed protein product [Choristocarpus tenellus]